MAARGPIWHSGSNFCNRARNGAWRGGAGSARLCAPGSEAHGIDHVRTSMRARETQALGRDARGRAHAEHRTPADAIFDVGLGQGPSGETRTPDTRIMISLRFGSAVSIEEPAGDERGHIRGRRCSLLASLFPLSVAVRPCEQHRARRDRGQHQCQLSDRHPASAGKWRWSASRSPGSRSSTAMPDARQVAAIERRARRPGRTASTTC